MSRRFVAFWSKTFTQDDVKYRIPLSTIKSAKPLVQKLIRLYGVLLEIEGHADLRFAFKTHEIMDEALRRISDALEVERTSPSPLGDSTQSTSTFELPSTLAMDASHRNATETLSPITRTIAHVVAATIPDSVRMRLPKAINVPRDLLVKRPPLHFMCLTIGSRGDVQPYIALGLGLKKEGHRVTIVTHAEYEEWILGFGIEHRTAGGDPGALMKLSVENKVRPVFCMPINAECDARIN